jgi:hypothetical protein
VLRRIFGLKGGEVTGEWRKLHNKELCSLYTSLSIIRIIKSRMRWEGHVAQTGEKKNAFRLLLRRPRCRCVANIKVGLGETGCSGMDWIDLAQDRDKWKALVKQ